MLTHSIMIVLSLEEKNLLSFFSFLEEKKKREFGAIGNML